MSDKEPYLKIKMEGDAVGPGRVPVSHLLGFLTNLNKAFQRTGRVLMGNSGSAQQGRPPKSINEEIALDLVLLTHGSPAVILGLERQRAQTNLPEMDFGQEVFEKAFSGLAPIQEQVEILPEGYDAGVLMAWRDAGKVFNQGIEKIEFTLHHRAVPFQTSFTPSGCTRIQERIKGPQTNIRTIEGRLLMVDFKEHGTRCRVHPPVGEPILCLFDEEQKAEVLEDILQYVRIVGEAKENPISGKITDIRIHDIERLEDQDETAADLLPQGTPVFHGFWTSPPLDALSAAQHVQPMADVRALFGTWPGEADDEFEAAIGGLRHHVMTEGPSHA